MTAETKTAPAALFLGGSHHGERYTVGTEPFVTIAPRYVIQKGREPITRETVDPEVYERRSVRFLAVAHPIRVYVIKHAGAEHDTAALLAAFLEGRPPHV